MKKTLINIKKTKLLSGSEQIYFHDTKYINGLKNSKIYNQNCNRNFVGNKDIKNSSFINIDNQFKKTRQILNNSSVEVSKNNEINLRNKLNILNHFQRQTTVLKRNKHQKLMKEIIDYTSFSNHELIYPKKMVEASDVNKFIL